ncbi:hypothetical protein [Parvibacter caecicola]|uniref:hypothetical protein n=1 Tax=Parvibacter caecicola TaxID=747645 RepID=UPI0027310D01|nr:hypothetical protein [Parvibacter caecicola]
MANLSNALMRSKINDATAECRACARETCTESCWEMLQLQLDEILDEARKGRECRNLSRDPRWLLCSECGAFTRVTDATSLIPAKGCGNCGAKAVG